jgi:hypothetical protein
LEPPRRPALANHVHRIARLGSQRSFVLTAGISRHFPLRTGHQILNVCCWGQSSRAALPHSMSRYSQELTFPSSPIRRFDRRLVLEPLNKGHHGWPKRVRPLTRRVTARTAHLT